MMVSPAELALTAAWIVGYSPGTYLMVPARTGDAVTNPKLTTNARINKILNIFFTLHLLHNSSLYSKSPAYNIISDFC